MEVTPEWHQVNNPLDIWPMVEYHGMKRPYDVSIKAMLEDKNIDSIVVAVWCSALWKYMPNFDELKKFGKTIYFVIEGPREEVHSLGAEYEMNGFPVFPNVITAIEVLGKVTDYAAKLCWS